MLDACPGVLSLHEAADGYMARVRLPGGRVDARALQALAEAARLGNGIVELTSRAGVQVRGLSADGADALASILSSGGLLPSVAHDRVRNILAAPLAGRQAGAVATVDAIVQALDRELCADATLAQLPGRFLFAVDDGTHVLAQLGADVELVAERAGLRLFLGGSRTSLVVPPAQAAKTALGAARAFVDRRRADGDGAWRVRELRGGAERLALDLDLGIDKAVAPTATAQTMREARCLGLHAQRDGLFAVTVLPPLARLDPAQLTTLARCADARGCGDARVSPWRTLSFVDLRESVAPELLQKLEHAGLVSSDASGWRGLSACAGLGACVRARVDVRAEAAKRAAVRDADSPIEHWSACERRCGEPPDAEIRVVAGERGLAWS